MGANTKKLRTRIKSVDSTLHLTKAMGLVASSKIRRATEGMNKSREYANSLIDAVAMLSASPECAKSPYLRQRDGNRICLVVVAGDRGLAGGYNANAFRMAKQFDTSEIIPIGKRSHDRYGGTLYTAEGFSYSDAIALSQKLCDDFWEGRFDKIGIVCTKYVSVMTQEAQVKWIFPLERNPEAKSKSIIFEPDEITVLNAVVSEYVAAVLVACVRESFASEVAARRCAMDSAGKNAQQMIDDLRLEYNRARQGAITQEITEIVAGSGA